LLLGDSPFDALLMDVTWLPKYAEAGWLEPLDPWFDQTAFDQLILGARLGNHYKDQLYRWPLGADVGVLYWRTDLMEAPPSTPEQLSEIAINLVQAKRVANGYVWQGRQYEGLSCNFVEVLHGFGGQWMNQANGQLELDATAAARAAAWMQSLITSGASPRAVTNYSESETLQAFKAGDAAFMRNWPYAWAELQKPESNVQGNVGITLMVAEPDQSPAATVGSWGLSLLKQSPHPEAAVEAIRYLTSEAAQRERFLNQGYTPTSQSLFTDPELIAVSSALPEIAKALDHSVSRPPTPLYAQLSDLLQRQLNGLLTADAEQTSSVVGTTTSASAAAMNGIQTKSDMLLKATGAEA
jgi:multiple sugar transport system substrate-binding protein